jgi:hypothetical protein
MSILRGSVQITYDDPNNEAMFCLFRGKIREKPSGFCCSEVLFGGQSRFLLSACIIFTIRERATIWKDASGMIVACGQLTFLLNNDALVKMMEIHKAILSPF